MARWLVVCVGVVALAACEPAGGGGGYWVPDAATAGDGGTGPGDPCTNGSRDGDETDVDCGGSCGPCATGEACLAAGDCASGFCTSAYVCGEGGCGNGALDPGEEGVDCGGPCGGCVGGACGADADCATGWCDAGSCGAPTCADGVKNGAETGVDCGGDCSQCQVGEGCKGDLNCVSGFCKAGFCAAPTCADGAQNQGEADVDCGGPCTGCAVGMACAGHADCSTGKCDGGVCAAVAPSCDDDTQNGSETDVDCGGTCGGCAFGKACLGPADCTSEICEGGACGAPASCDDGEENGDESDVDCGGSCSPCAVTKFCEEHADCKSHACVFGVCEKPTCGDGILNQGEADADCAGPCPSCDDGRSCGGPGDCASDRCTGGVCTSCQDGEKNGGEVDADCGGPCGACGLGKVCGKPSDCASGACEGGQCCAPNACGECSATPEEVCDGVDNDCDGATDEAADIGTPAPCDKQAGVCAGTVAVCEGQAGWVCDDSVYAAHHAAYEEGLEATCDGLDNDCDGETDEYNLNACGQCGPVPVETCNGHDDDCDGDTDEDPRCDVCASPPAPTQLISVATSWGFQHSWTRWMTSVGDEAFLLAYPRGNYTSTHIFRLADGQEQSDWKPGIPSTGSSSLTSGGGMLHVGAIGYGDYFEGRWYGITPSGTVTDQAVLGNATNLSGSLAEVAWGAGSAYVAYVKGEQGMGVSRITEDGTAESAGSFPGAHEYGSQLAVAGDGTVAMAWGSDWENGSVTFRQADGTSETVCVSGCGYPAMRAGADGDFHVVYPSGPGVAYRAGKGTGWSTKEAVGPGSGPNLDFDPFGRPVAVWIHGSSVKVAVRTGPSTWHEETVLTDDGTLGQLTGAAVAVDDAGRLHVGVRSRVGDSYAATEEIAYAIHCLDVEGADPVDPGDPGPGACGADPGATCQQQCGGESASGCWCNASCVDYGDCCPDYEACCAP